MVVIDQMIHNLSLIQIQTTYIKTNVFFLLHVQGECMIMQLQNILNIRVFQRFLKPNESLKYEIFISNRVQIWYFEQH